MEEDDDELFDTEDLDFLDFLNEELILDQSTRPHEDDDPPPPPPPLGGSQLVNPL